MTSRKAKVASTFGEGFAKRISAMEPGRWQGPIPSSFGAAFRLHRANECREACRRSMLSGRPSGASGRTRAGSRRSRSFIASLRERYEIVVETPRPRRQQPRPRDESLRAVLCCSGGAAGATRAARMNFGRAIWRCARRRPTPTACFSRFPRGARTCGSRSTSSCPKARNDVTPPRASFSDGAYVERRTIRRDGGLAGQTVSIEGLSATSTDVLVRIESLAGAMQTERLSPTKTTFVVQAAPGAGEVAATYLRLGVEHILFGFDHLLFVLALVILVRDWRRVALTVTAFTIAHSITLAAATLGLVNVPGPPVEAAIALSIVLVAVEIVNARRGKPSLTARCRGSSPSASGFCTASVLPARWPKWDCRNMRSPSRCCFSMLAWRSGNLSSSPRSCRRYRYCAMWRPRLLEPALVQRALDRLDVTVAYAIGVVAAYWLVERTTAFFA